MNDVVNQLVTIVDGTAATTGNLRNFESRCAGSPRTGQTKRHLSPPRGRIGLSNNTWQEIADNGLGANKPAQESSARYVIPLEDDETGLDEFNS